ncbi:MAG TPA: hypothetical protein VK348_13790, partial [Planctomycetota bacterium]|nr:hypothetical protein [Planctomycetota bacterium]
QLQAGTAPTPVPASPPPRRGRRPGLVPLLALGAVCGAAAAAILFAILPVTQPQGVRQVARVELAVMVGAIECSAPGVLPEPEPPFRLAAGERRDWNIGTGSRLMAVGDGEVDMLVRPFGVVTTLPHTQLEVRSMERYVKNGVAAAGAVTLAVVAGAVTWHTLIRTERAEAGGQLRLEKPADGPDTGELAALRQQLLLQQQQNAELQHRNQELETQASRTVLAPPAPAAARPDEPALAPVAAGPTFDDPKYRDALAAVDWKAMGAVSNEMTPMLAKLLEVLDTPGAELPVDVAIQVQKLNQKLIEQLPGLMKAGLPGYGPNGVFTNPLVVGNSLASTLQAGGQPLSANQQAALANLLAGFAAENQSIHDQPRDFDLEQFAAETAMKDRMYASLSDQLTTEQRNAIYPEGSTRFDGGSLFATGVTMRPYADAIVSDNAGDFARMASHKLEQQLGLDEATSTQVRQVLEQAMLATPDLWRDRASPVELGSNSFMRAGRTAAALQAQVGWMRQIASNVSLTPDQRKKLFALKRVYVPVPR